MAQRSSAKLNGKEKPVSELFTVYAGRLAEATAIYEIQNAQNVQPIIVRRRGDSFELIDGQQRLTTLFLILKP